MTTIERERIRYCVEKTVMWMIPTSCAFTFMFLLLKDFLARTTPYSYVIVVGMFAMAVVMFIDFANAKYEAECEEVSDKEMSEAERKNWQKFYSGQFCEVVPVEAKKLPDTPKDGNLINYQEFVTENQKCVAVMTGKQTVLVYRIYIKNGDVRPERYATEMSERQFLKRYAMATTSAPEEKEEIQIKIINP